MSEFFSCHYNFCLCHLITCLFKWPPYLFLVKLLFLLRGNILLYPLLQRTFLSLVDVSAQQKRNLMLNWVFAELCMWQVRLDTVLIEKTGTRAQQQCVMVFLLANANSSFACLWKCTMPCMYWHWFPRCPEITTERGGGSLSTLCYYSITATMQYRQESKILQDFTSSMLVLMIQNKGLIPRNNFY